MENLTFIKDTDVFNKIHFSHSHTSLSDLMEVPKSFDKELNHHILNAEKFLDTLRLQITSPGNRKRKIIKKSTEIEDQNTFEKIGIKNEQKVGSEGSMNTISLNLNQSTILKRRKKANTIDFFVGQTFSTLPSIQEFSTMDGITIPIHINENKNRKFTQGDCEFIANFEEFQ